MVVGDSDGEGTAEEADQDTELHREPDEEDLYRLQQPSPHMGELSIAQEELLADYRRWVGPMSLLDFLLMTMHPVYVGVREAPHPSEGQASSRARVRSH